MSAITKSSLNGTTAQIPNAGTSDSTGAVRNKNLLEFAGTTISLMQHLHHVGERLQQALPPDSVRADAVLHPADDLALPVREVGHRENQRHEHRDDLQHRDDHEPQRLRQREPQASGAARACAVMARRDLARSRFAAAARAAHDRIDGVDRHVEIASVDRCAFEARTEIAASTRRRPRPAPNGLRFRARARR